MVLDRRVELAAAVEAGEGVVHAGAEEADDGDHEELDLWRGVPQVAAGDADGTIHEAPGVLGGEVGRVTVSRLVDGHVMTRLDLLGKHDGGNRRQGREQRGERGVIWKPGQGGGDGGTSTIATCHGAVEAENGEGQG